MDERLADWNRPHYLHAGGRPFIFFVIYGDFCDKQKIESQRYRSLGVPAGLDLVSYTRTKHSDTFTLFEEGYL
jgi:hypothetical protein